MPYKSALQRRYMHAQHPKIAARWDKRYGGKIQAEKAPPSRDAMVRRLQGQQDSRGPVGMLARGKVVYHGGTHAAHSGGGPQYGRPKGSKDKVPVRSSIRRKLAERKKKM